jgi:hypothetical protein
MNETAAARDHKTIEIFLHFFFSKCTPITVVSESMKALQIKTMNLKLSFRNSISVIMYQLSTIAECMSGILGVI